MNAKVPFQEITNKNRRCMKSPTPETQCADVIFEMKHTICAVNFTNDISRSGEHNTTFENS